MKSLRPFARLQPRERLLALGGALVLLLLVFDRFVLGPWSRHRTMMRRESRQMEKALQNYRRLLARKDRVLQELGRYQRYLRPSIADDLQMAALLKEVQQLAEESRVKISEVKPLAVEADEKAKRYSLEVRFQCVPEEWADFVFRVETSPSLYQVVRAGLSTQADQPDRLEGYLRLMSTSGLSGSGVEG